MPPLHLRRAPLAAFLAALFLLAGCTGDAAESGDQARDTSPPALPLCSESPEAEPGSCRFDTRGHYTSKEPYRPLQAMEAYEPVPEGFRVVSVQHVARHGSRTLSSPGDDDLMKQLWEAAREEGALTPLGELLGPVLDDILRVHARVGYGRSSGLGEREHEEMAARLVARHPAFFDSLATGGHGIDWFHSGRTRADESGEAFVRGLGTARPGLAGLVEAGGASPETLYFNAAEGSEAFQAFQAYRAEDPRHLAAVAAIEGDPRTRQMARRMLLPLFSEAFVERLAGGELEFRAAADPDDRISDELDAAEALYGLYSIAIGMTEEAAWDFGRFMDPEAVAWFAYVDDAGSFYGRGPGFADEDISWAGARALVADLFERVDRVVSGDASHPVTLRFTHAQALMPLAAWLNLDGAGEGAHPEVLYTYENSSWRSERVSPMAANVQWDVVRNDEGTVLVRMLHQEAEVAFAPPCRPWREGSRFFELDALRTCTGLTR